MAEVQTSYSETVNAGYPGMVANGETSNRISRTCEDAAGIGFGKAVYRGSNDHGCSGSTTLTAAPSEDAGNTGTGEIGAVTVTEEEGAQIGRYTLTLLETSATGEFTVEAPDGTIIGNGNIATEFDAGGLTFTWANGGTMTVGDTGYIDVTGGEFLGITLAHQGQAVTSGQDADEYHQYDNVGIMTGGAIYVEAGETVVAGGNVYVDADGNFVDSTGIPCPGWVFDEGGADGDYVVIVKR